jgi:hypothetical protein
MTMVEGAGTRLIFVFLKKCLFNSKNQMSVSSRQSEANLAMNSLMDVQKTYISSLESKLEKLEQARNEHAHEKAHLGTK